MIEKDGWNKGGKNRESGIKEEKGREYFRGVVIGVNVVERIGFENSK